MLTLDPRWPVKALQTAVTETVPELAVQLSAGNIQAFMGGEHGTRASMPKMCRRLLPMCWKADDWLGLVDWHVDSE